MIGIYEDYNSKNKVSDLSKVRKIGKIIVHLGEMLSTMVTSIDYLNGLNPSNIQLLSPPSTKDLQAVINNEKLMTPIIKISKVLNSFGDQGSMLTKLFAFKIFILSLINRSNNLIKSLKFQSFSKDL